MESERPVRTAVRPHRAILAMVVAALVAAAAAAQVASLFYREVARDGRVYVFNLPEQHRLFETTGEMGKSITLVGAGPNGETIVADSETALELFQLRHGPIGYERPAPVPAKGKPTYPAVKIGALWYLSAQTGDAAGKDFSRFSIKRGYINVEAKVSDFISARITPDVTLDSSGDLKVRLKYAYAKFHAKDLGFVTKPELEVGVAHMPWLDFEEHINNYRMQDTMFMERNGMFNSADIGLTAMALIGGTVSEEYQKTVSKAYPGRWGSVAFGVYNGGGYHASEANENKVLEGRLTVRPLPDLLTGLQISYFGVRGKGNTAAEPDWEVDAFMLSYESATLVFTGTWMDGSGNQRGNAVDAHGRALSRDGWSAFVEAKPSQRWSVIARFDHFDPDTDSLDAANDRTIAGVAYHLGKGNTVLLDWDRVEYEKTGTPDDERLQLTLQVKY